MSMVVLDQNQLDTLADKVAARMANQSAALQAADQRTVRDLVERFEKVEIGPNPKQHPPRRSDWRPILTHIPYILAMEFQHEGATVKLGDLKWHALTLSVGADWMFALGQQVTRATQELPKGQQQTLSPGYQIRVLSTLQCIFKWHVKEKAIPGSPVRGWPRPDNKKGAREGHCTEAEFEKFAAVAHPTLLKMATVAARTGMRHGEVRELQITEIDWEKKLINLPAERCKNGDARTIPMTSDVFSILEAQARSVPGPWLFPSPRASRNAPVTERAVQEWMREAREKAGIVLNNNEKFVFHHLRHKWAIDMCMRKMAPGWIGDVGGWKTDSQIRRYTKLAGAEAIEEARAQMEPLPGAPANDGPAKGEIVAACPVCKKGHVTMRDAADCEDACKAKASRRFSPFVQRRGPVASARSDRRRTGAVG